MITTTTAPHTINVFSRTMSNMTGQNLKQVHHHTFSMWLLEPINRCVKQIPTKLYWSVENLEQEKQKVPNSWSNTLYICVLKEVEIYTTKLLR